MRRWRRMGTCSCDLQHDGAASSATSKSSSIAQRFIVVLAMCTTVLVSLAATPPVSAARLAGLQKDQPVLPLWSNMQKVEMDEGSMTLVPVQKLIVTSEQQEVTLKPINLTDESNQDVETYMMAEGRELVAQTDDYTAPCANNKHDKSVCRHG